MDSLFIFVFLILIEQGRGGLIELVDEGQGNGLPQELMEEALCYPETSLPMNYRTLPETGSWKFCLKTQVGTGFTGSSSRGIRSIRRISGNPTGDCASLCTSLPGCMTFALNQYGRCFTTRWCPGYFDLNYSVFEMNNVTERCSPVKYLPAPTPSQVFN